MSAIEDCNLCVVFRCLSLNSLAQSFWKAPMSYETNVTSVYEVLPRYLNKQNKITIYSRQ